MSLEMADLPASQKVADPLKDVAMDSHMRPIRINESERRTFQVMHVKVGTRGRGNTTTPYDPQTDAPPEGDSTPSILPTRQALLGEEGRTKEMLQVGIIPLDNPEKFQPKGERNSRTRARATKPEDIVDRPNRVHVVVVERTPYVMPVGTSQKFYVLVHEFAGLCDMRLISRSQVFFYSEYLQGVNVSNNLKDRERKIGVNIRTAAARIKSTEPTQQIDIAGTQDDARTPSNSQSVTETDNPNNLSSLLTEPSLPTAREDVNEDPEQAAPVLQSISPESFAAEGKFFNHRDDFDEADATALISGLKVSTSHEPTMQP